MHRRVLFVVCLSVALGCSVSPSIEEIRVQLPVDPVSLDSSLSEDGASLRILMNTMEGLVGYDATGKLEFRLAEGVEEKRDGRELEFRLRPGVKWSDGRDVRAEDFVTGIQRSLAPTTGSKLSAVFSAIEQENGVMARDGRVVIRLKRRAPYLIRALAMSQAMPQRKDILDANGGKLPFNGPVTGSYRIVEYKLNQYLRLEPNPEYWRRKEEKPLPVRMVIVEDEATAKNLFVQGRLDILTRVDPFDLERFRSMGWVRQATFPATYYLSFNVKKDPFRDLAWRRAVAAAINKSEIVGALKSGETAAESLVPRGLEGFFDEDLLSQSRAGWLAAVAKRKTMRASVVFDSGARNRMIIEKVQRDILEKTPLRLEIQNLDWKSYLKTLSTDAPPLFRFSWLAPFLDPIVHLQVFTSKNPNNASKWSNAKYDRLVSEIEAMPSGAEREAKIREAQKILIMEEVVVVPLYHYVQVMAVRPEVEGFSVNPFGWIPFKDLRKNPKNR